MNSKTSKVLPVLILMRILAAAVLILLVTLLYLDIEIRITQLSVLIPFVYLFMKNIYWTPKIAILIVPLMVNIALWMPRYSSYIFLRVALYVERIKLYCAVPFTLILLIKGVSLSHKPVFWGYIALVLFNLLLLCINRIAINALHEYDYKEYFGADLESELDMKILVRKLAIVFCIIIACAIISESIYRRHLLPNYNVITTREFQFPYLKTSNKNNVANYSDKLSVNVGNRTRLSQDNKMLLMRMRTLDDEGMDLFVFDIDNLENIYRLQTPLVDKASRTILGYTFTPDGKYVVVGDQLQANSKIKFQVLELATGKSNDRFGDYKRRLKPLAKDDIVRNIKFNPNGNYFVVVTNKQIEVWDYQKGIPIYTDNLPVPLISIKWVSDTTFITSDKQKNRYVANIYTISSNNSVTVDNRYILDQTLERRDLYDPKEHRQYSTKLTTSNKYLYYAKELSIWDVANEQKLFTITRSSNIVDSAFHPNNKDMVILEQLDNKTFRVVIWDIVKQCKEREIILPQLDWNGSMHLVDNGKKIMLIGKKMYLIELE